MDKYEELAKEWIYQSEPFDYETALNTLSNLFKMVADSAIKDSKNHEEAKND